MTRSDARQESHSLLGALRGTGMLFSHACWYRRARQKSAVVWSPALIASVECGPVADAKGYKKIDRSNRPGIRPTRSQRT